MQAQFSLKNPVHFLALGFGSGLLKPAPGTWGTLAGVPVYFVLVTVASFVPNSLLFYSLITLLFFMVGIYLCGQTARDVGVHDHGAIVWDEIVGLLVALIAFPPTLLNVVLAFLLFRIFDIVKPWPIKLLDQHVQGGFGIMVDDLIAGVFAWIGLAALHHFVF